MLQTNQLSIFRKSTGQALLENFTFALNPEERIAVIGEEGNGKSTLLKLLYDPSLAEPYAEWQGDIRRDGKLGYLFQELSETDRRLTAYEYLSHWGVWGVADAGELAHTAGVLGLPVELAYADQPVGTLSGGEKVKLQLLRILAHQPDVLLLDEPTNDIDIETLEWMERFLLSCRLPVLYISHDETLLERTATGIIHIEQLRSKTECRHTIARVPYRVYVEERLRGITHQTQMARKEKQEYDAQMDRYRQIYERVHHDQNAISRGNPAGGRLLKKKMHAVKSMGRRFEREKQDMTQKPVTEDAILLSLPEVSLPGGKEVLRFSLPELSVGGIVLAREVSLSVTGPERIGIIGRNGAGKTTLLRAVADALQQRGDIRALYMPQDYVSLLPPESTPLDYLAPSGAKEDVTRARTYMGSMRYTPEEMVRPVATLSGGQKAKLFFAKMALGGYDVLILDEPTRNFSALSGPVVRAALAEFGGAIISVSHDRKYLSEVCDILYRLTPSGLVPEPSGNHTEVT
jgi:ATPase subunit of ABC transporter with duplicated ATPase domains